MKFKKGQADLLFFFLLIGRPRGKKCLALGNREAIAPFSATREGEGGGGAISGENTHTDWAIFLWSQERCVTWLSRHFVGIVATIYVFYSKVRDLSLIGDQRKKCVSCPSVLPLFRNVK